MKFNKVLLFSVFIVLLFGMGFVTASDDNSTLLEISDNNIDDIESYSSSNVLSIEPQDNGVGESKNYVVNQRNYNMYFDKDNNLKSEYNGEIITFDGEFKDKGVITISGDNTKINGRNTLFNNTVFNIKGNGVVLTNLNFVLNESFKTNNNAGIYVTGDNVTVYNINMDYDTPADVDAIGVYSYDNNGFKLINSSFNYIGHASHTGYDYSALLVYSDNAWVSGNNFTSALPLRSVVYGDSSYGGVGMDRVSVFAAGQSKNLQFTDNDIYSTINFGQYADSLYPTLSTVFIYGCDNSTLNKNNIQVEDLYTRKNQANYLYGIDIHRVNDISILENVIDIFTYGGHDYLGTAYPIQVEGPAYNVKVAYNYLHSVSNGPNIGVYSMNYYGGTQIDIISNFINITGKATNHQWGLVAGIEVQDSDDRILNNTIIVDTVGGYKAGDRIFGISYSQNTDGNHKYDIRYNKVNVPGPIAISLNQGMSSTTSDTNVMYNVLITGVGEGGDRAVSIGGNGQNNIIRYNTNGADTIRHMSERDLPTWLKNYNNGLGNGHGVDLSWLNTANTGGVGLNTGEGKGNGLSFNSKVNGNNPNGISSEAVHGDMNSTHYTYGSSGVSIAGSSSAGGSGSGQSSQSDVSESRAYEVTKQIPEITSINYIQAITGILLAILLLIIGYKRKEHVKEEY